MALYLLKNTDFELRSCRDYRSSVALILPVPAIKKKSVNFIIRWPWDYILCVKLRDWYLHFINTIGILFNNNKDYLKLFVDCYSKRKERRNYLSLEQKWWKIYIQDDICVTYIVPNCTTPRVFCLIPKILFFKLLQSWNTNMCGI